MVTEDLMIARSIRFRYNIFDGLEPSEGQNVRAVSVRTRF